MKSSYIHVSDVETGEFSLVRDIQHLTTVGDTVVIYLTTHGKTLYGKYKGIVPQPKVIKRKDFADLPVTYYKCVRIK